MMNGFATSMIGWFTMVCAMGYFIWLEFKKSELEPDEEEEPPSSRLAFRAASF